MPFELDLLESLAAAIREAAAPRTWSRGVVLAREGAVEGREENEDEIVLAVRTKDRPIPPTVVLYPETEEWDCDCGTRLAVCPHTAAAVIAVVKARKDDAEALPEGNAPRRTLRYRLRRRQGLLELERLEVDADGTEVRLELPVRQAASRPGRELSLNEVDLDIDPLLQRGVTLIDRREQAKLLFERLEASSAVELEGVPVSINPNPYLPKGRILTRGDRYILRIESDATEVVAPDTVLVGSELRLLGETGLTGSRLEKLPIEKVYRRSELAVLTQEVLPIFDKRFPIEGKELLPRGRGKGRPRLELEVAMSDYAVSVTGSVVYGDPPSVRIVEGRPEYLGGVAPERDFEAEHRLVEKLRSELNLVPGRTTTVRGGEGAAFLEKVRRFEATSGRGLDLDDLPVLNPRLEMEGEGGFGLHLEAETEEGAVAADLRSALAAFETQQSLVPLLGGGWARLDQTWWTEHADAVALLLQLRDRDGQVPPLALPALGALAASLDAPPPPGLERLAPLFQDFSGLPEAPLPSDLEAELRPYQTEGHRWLAFLKSTGLGGLLADDMGLGKTLQTLTVLEARSLVVCPTSVLGNWAKELARFRPGLRAHVHHGPDRVMDEGADVVITTYALLRSDREILGAERWRVVVLDEAQAIKNPESLTARAAYGIEADFRLALTGTPVENRLSELWSQMHFVNPGLLGGRADFDSRFSDRIEAGDEVAQAKLRSRIKPFVLRRLKSEVARDLPPRTDMVLHVELDELERGVYDGVRAATRKEVAERLTGDGGNVMQALEALLRLRQAASHLGLLPGRAETGSTKLDLLVEVLAEAVAEGHKALVFSQWTSLLDLAEPHLQKSSLPFTRLDGSTRDREAVVESFQSADGPPVMLLSLKAGGTGLNLTAADHVFLLDPWWNPAVEDQAADRAHRIGQDRPVMVHRLVTRDTVEERILALQEKKRGLAEAAVGGAEAAVRITKDDLLQLLAD